MKRLVLILLTHFSLFVIGHSQSGFFNEPIFRISVFTHSIGIPFKDYVKRPVNFGFSVAAEFAYNKEKQNSLSQEIELSWFKHKHFNQGIMLKTNLSKNYFIDDGFFVAPSIGIGYIMDITEHASYSWKEENFKRTSGITHGFTTQVGVSAGKTFTKDRKNSYAPFIKYEGLIQLPYSDFTPFLPHSMLHLGSKIFITDND